LDQAQYRELEAFSKFGSDLDASTKLVLDKGVRNVEILKQPQYSPVSVEKQVAIIYLGVNNLLRDLPSNKVRSFEETFFAVLDARHKDILENFRKGKLENADLEQLKAVAKEVINTVK
jgi:F-type H+-transporting ATPase subunit alpha